MWLALRSLIWTIVFPGFFAGYVPWRFFGLGRTPFDRSETWKPDGPRSPVQDAGLVCAALGVVLLAACILEFARSGRGTLSPLDPPRVLVVRGLYRHVRNPMYLAVTAIVVGEALVMRSWPVAAYWAVWFFWSNLFVMCYEEPALRRQFGSSYDAYTKHVGRWWPAIEGYDTRGHDAPTP